MTTSCDVVTSCHCCKCRLHTRTTSKAAFALTSARSLRPHLFRDSLLYIALTACLSMDDTDALKILGVAQAAQLQRFSIGVMA